MARDDRRFRSSGADPVEQLRAWRNWREDTVELPVISGDEPLPQPAARPRRRPGAGVVVGLGLLAAALILSGLTAAGVGPVRAMLGADTGSDAPSTGATSTPATTTPATATPATATATPATESPRGPGAPGGGPPRPAGPGKGGPPAPPVVSAP